MLWTVTQVTLTNLINRTRFQSFCRFSGWFRNNESGYARSLFISGVFGRGFNSRRLHQSSMPLRLQLEYWNDGPWFVGRLPQVPGVFSQGSTLAELEDNVRDAYRLMIEEQDTVSAEGTVHHKEIEVPA